MASAISLVLFFFLIVAEEAQCIEFTFNGFNQSEANFTLDRVSIIKPSGLLRLTNRTQNETGQAFYKKPIQMKNISSSASPNAASFSTYFIFAIVPPDTGRGGYGFAFALAPTDSFSGAKDGHFLGLFNDSSDGQESNNIFAVEFDTVKGFNETTDSEGNHVGININSVDSNETKPASYYRRAAAGFKEEEMLLESGKPIQAWIEYDGINVVNVTICPIDKEKPSKPLISYSVNLASIVREKMYAGFSASTGTNASSHYILGWSFAMNGKAAAQLNLASLPMLPGNEKNSSSSFKTSIVALIASLCAVTVLLLGVLLFLTVRRLVMRHETLEDWELECPHRFHYHDLYAATKGFKQSEILGIGGFGTVYKAVLPSNGNEVAVKKITRNNSLQGLREFVAEIASLGRLRHKNLVNMQGWCKHKNDLLLIYDYIPNGSLDSLLFNRKDNFVLSWKHRFHIVKGIAAGLVYLHEEWEQVVIHRDVKSSNVLIDAEMNGRLGDFGLARLYDHGTMSHTTNVVGTIGYIAPELARTGKASASSDVYAYGILLLEVATGRRPIGSGQFILVDWVMELQQQGRILDAVDPMLNSRIYVVEEMQLILKLGLFCSHEKPEARPTMRQVMRYLNGDDKLPSVINDWGSIDHRQLSQMNSTLSEGTSENTNTTTYRSFSVSAMSTTSIDSGR